MPPADKASANNNRPPLRIFVLKGPASKGAIMSWGFDASFQSYSPAPDTSALDYAGGGVAEPFSVDAGALSTPDPWTAPDLGSFAAREPSFTAAIPDAISATPPGGVDITLNDVTMTLGSILSIVPALVVRGAMSVFPGLADDFLPDHRSVFGTNDKSGPLGWLVGDSDKSAEMPGVLGISASIAGWLGVFGDFAEFEEGGRRHNLNTGSGHESETFSSIGETLGQGLGVLSRKLGIGSTVESIVTSLFGDSDGYGFVNGVQSGSWVNIGSRDDMAS